jgi:hypothetical protein
MHNAKPKRIGVIGESGVGKSTLLNALLSERLQLLPQGGIGPLTALPIEVRHASTPYLKVCCSGAVRVREMLEACLRQAVGANDNQGEDRHLFQLAMLVASGSQFGRVPNDELVWFLRACLGDEGGDGVSPALAERIARVQRVIELGDRGAAIEIQAGTELRAMLAALDEHGSGSLSPLTSSIELGWDAPILADNLALVDLPGLGVANDIHPLQTRAQAGRLPALLLVVDRSGLTEAAAATLRRVIEGAPGPQSLADDGVPRLVIAGTKLDQSAAEAASGRPGRASWRAICASLAARMQTMVRSQLACELRRAPRPTNRLSQVFERAEIVAVFPREYQRLHRRDPEELARFQDPRETGIPELMERLRALSE